MRTQRKKNIQNNKKVDYNEINSSNMNEYGNSCQSQSKDRQQRQQQLQYIWLLRYFETACYMGDYNRVYELGNMLSNYG